MSSHHFRRWVHKHLQVRGACIVQLGSNFPGARPLDIALRPRYSKRPVQGIAQVPATYVCNVAGFEGSHLSFMSQALPSTCLLR